MGTSGNSLSRNHGLDFLKGIAACLLVFAHVVFPWPYGAFLTYVSTCGVSVFFMTSGYFSVGKSRKELFHAIRRVALYLLAAYFLYLFKMLIANGFEMSHVLQYLKDRVFTASHLWKTLVYTQSAICPVAWFLISLLECYTLKLVMGRLLRYLGILGILVGIIVVLPPISSRMDFPLSNPWIWGIPCFVLGELLHENEDRLQVALDRRLLVFICLAGITINLLARYCGTQWWYIGNLLSAPALFLLFGGSGMKFNRFCLLGSVYAFFIYIVHPLVGHFFSQMRPYPGTLEQWVRPLVALAVTILLAIAFYSLKSWMFSRFRQLKSSQQ